MPAGSDPSRATTLPVTFRPLGVRVAVALNDVLLLGVCAVIWFASPPEVRARYDILQRLTLLAFGLAFAAGGYALARCRVEARPDGLAVVNGFRTRRFAWAQVVGVTLRAGAPWAVLDLSDGTTTAAMGIQGSDGSRATAQVRRLRAILAEQGRDAGA